MEKIVMQEGSSVPVVSTPLYNLIAIDGQQNTLQALKEIAGTVPGVSVMASISPQQQSQTQTTILCSVAPDGRRTFCGEFTQIIALELEELASGICGLAVPDVPIYLWLPHSKNLSQEYPWLAPQVDMLITDAWAPLSAENGCQTTDLPWLRLSPWMEAAAELFDHPQIMQKLPMLSRIYLSLEGKTAHTPGCAKSMAGWFAEALKSRYPRVESDSHTLRLLDGDGGNALRIDVASSGLFDSVCFEFGSPGTKIVLGCEDDGVQVVGDPDLQISRPLRSDAQILVDEINGTSLAALSGALTNSASARSYWQEAIKQ